jgi:hypothetical protein
VTRAGVEVVLVVCMHVCNDAVCLASCGVEAGVVHVVRVDVVEMMRFFLVVVVMGAGMMVVLVVKRESEVLLFFPFSLASF